jgi:hypothetical protein
VIIWFPDELNVTNLIKLDNILQLLKIITKYRTRMNVKSKFLYKQIMVQKPAHSINRLIRNLNLLIIYIHN